MLQIDAVNQSRIRTISALPLTTNLRLADAPGNVLVPAAAAGLPADSVVNVSQLITIDKDYFEERTGRLGEHWLRQVEDGVRMLLGL